MPQENIEYEEPWIGLDEIDQIMNRTFYSNQGEKSTWKKRKTARESYYEGTTLTRGVEQKKNKQAYLLVDGYNIIYAWPELYELAKENMDGARIKLMDELCNYQGIKKCEVIIRGQGSKLLSARELKEQMDKAHKDMMESYEEQQVVEHNYLEAHLSEAAKKCLQPKV